MQPSQPQPTHCANRCWDSSDSDTVMMIQCGDDSSKKLGRNILKAILSAAIMSFYHIYSKFGWIFRSRPLGLHSRRGLGRDDINIWSFRLNLSVPFLLKFATQLCRSPRDGISHTCYLHLFVMCEQVNMEDLMLCIWAHHPSTGEPEYSRVDLAEKEERFFKNKLPKVTH